LLGSCRGLLLCRIRLQRAVCLGLGLQDRFAPALLVLRSFSPGIAEVPVTQIIDSLNDALGDQLIGQARQSGRLHLTATANSHNWQPQPVCPAACHCGCLWGILRRLISQPIRPIRPAPTLALCPLQDRACPSCGSQLSLKFSSKSRVPFVGCSTYPGMAPILGFGGGDAGCMPLMVPCPTGGAAFALLPHPALTLLPCRVQLPAPYCRRLGH
jgi:hypothetical protein